MKEEHYYESYLCIGPCQYNTKEVRNELLDYFEKNSKKVFGYWPDITNHSLWGFHKDGISIHLQITKLKEPESNFVDVRLVSDKTPTKDLEEKLKKLIEPFKLK